MALQAEDFIPALKYGAQVGSDNIENELDTADLSDGAVTEAKIADDAVTNAKLADNAANSAQIADNAVTTTKIKNANVTEEKIIAESVDGLHLHRIARATYDFASDGGTQGAIGLGVTLPDNAIITRAWYEVITTLTSSTDAATVSIDIPTDDAAGIVAAIAINDASNPWDQGLHDAIQDGALANYSNKTTAARELSITVATEDLTAGKFILYAEYVVSD